MKKLAAVATLVVALSLALAYSLASRAKPEDKGESIRPVRVQRIEPNAIENVSVFSGEIKARFETPMAFRVPGRIAQRHVDVGTAVKKGQLLATLEASDYQLNVQSLLAQVGSAEADFRFKTGDLSRGGELLKKGFVSQVDFDRRQSAYDQAKAKVEQSRALLAQTRNQSEYTSLRALSDGIVTSVDAESGQVVTAGQTVLRIARLEEKEVTIQVPENRLDEVRKAETLRISLWARPDKSYAGRLREISPGADPVTRTYIGKVTVLEPDAAVQLGMTASVTVGGKRAERGQHVLPLASLVAREDGSYVWVVDPATGTVRLMPVKIGTYSGNRISIREGLSNGDLVVTAGAHKLVPLQHVAILEGDAK
jgi:multidrug efflux system membrane fusion protein